jgi:hypothetical protein
VLPRVEHLDAFWREELLSDQEVDDFGAEEFFKRLEGCFRQGEESGAGWWLEAAGWSWGLRRRVWRVPKKEAVGHEGVNVGMEVEVFAEGVQGHDHARYAFGAVERRAEVFGNALVGQGAELFEEAAMALEIGPEHFRDGQDVMTVRHWGQHVVQDEPGGGLDVFLVAGGAEPAALAGEGQQVFVLAIAEEEEGSRRLLQRNAPISAFNLSERRLNRGAGASSLVFIRLRSFAGAVLY